MSDIPVDKRSIWLLSRVAKGFRSQREIGREPKLKWVKEGTEKCTSGELCWGVRGGKEA